MITVYILLNSKTLLIPQIELFRRYFNENFEIIVIQKNNKIAIEEASELKIKTITTTKNKFSNIYNYGLFSTENLINNLNKILIVKDGLFPIKPFAIQELSDQKLTVGGYLENNKIVWSWMTNIGNEIQKTVSFKPKETLPFLGADTIAVSTAISSFELTSDFVFALTCCIPIETVTVDLTTSGCCLELTEEGDIYTVGDGSVTATVSGTADADCGTMSAKINGFSSPHFFEDCTALTITLESLADPDCCPCTELDRECLVPHDTSMAMAMKNNFLIRKNNLSQGKTGIYINSKELARRITKRRNLK